MSVDCWETSASARKEENIRYEGTAYMIFSRQSSLVPRRLRELELTVELSLTLMISFQSSPLYSVACSSARATVSDRLNEGGPKAKEGTDVRSPYSTGTLRVVMILGR